MWSTELTAQIVLRSWIRNFSISILPSIITEGEFASFHVILSLHYYYCNSILPKKDMIYMFCSVFQFVLFSYGRISTPCWWVLTLQSLHFDLWTCLIQFCFHWVWCTPPVCGICWKSLKNWVHMGQVEWVQTILSHRPCLLLCINQNCLDYLILLFV